LSRQPRWRRQESLGEIARAARARHDERHVVCDHRILYGADGAEFLARVRELLEQPLALAL
jgi:pyruvate/2-oxoglutarate dehydrogenase complex dihydrolipoamide acyltransferase (E2) component